ncbi:MAG TPA: ATP-binding protein [Polyangiaceae bacterium]|jgi:signal transduction histidine kinase
MRLTFRLKLLALVGVTALAFLVIIVASSVIASRVDRQLVAIQQSYLPKIELEPELVAQLERMQRGFQDAVAAHDLETLASTRDLETAFFDRLDGARSAVDPADARELRAAVEDYYATASDVSRRLIAGETGEQLVDAMSSMQAKRSHTLDLIRKTAALDRHDLTSAFAAVEQAEASARSYGMWVAVACLSAVLMLSLVVSRGLLRSVASLTRGFERFGRGDFRQPIEVSSRDELADLAVHANEMSVNLERLGAEQKSAELALQVANKELEAFSYSVAHDLRAPLRGINGLSHVLLEDYGPKLDAEAHDYLQRIGAAADRMGQLIDALLTLSRVTRVELRRETVNMTRLADAVVKQLRGNHPDRHVDFQNQDDVVAEGDVPLLRAVLENLIGNAWKFTNGREPGVISFGAENEDGEVVYSIRDNGAGFDMAYAAKLFAPFQRLHKDSEFAGTGIGLATVQRIIHRHGGRIWAEGDVGKGATFRFTLSNQAEGAST